MLDDPVFQAELRAIERLGWTTQQVFSAAIQYGDVGSEDDVPRRLMPPAEGRHTRAQP
jgi:hypothetical protein